MDNDTCLNDEKFRELIEKGNYNFNNKCIEELQIEGFVFEESLSFESATIEGDVKLKDCKIEGYVNFKNATIKGSITIEDVTTKEHVTLYQCKVRNDIIIKGAEINGYIDLEKSEIGGDLEIKNSIIDGDLILREAKVLGKIVVTNSDINYSIDLRSSSAFAIDISKAIVGSLIMLGLEDDEKEKIPDVKNKLSLHKTLLYASYKYDIIGSKDYADKYFYRAMVYRRIHYREQPGFRSKLVYILDYMVGELSCKYGISWSRPIVLWILTLLIFSIIFWFIGGVGDTNNNPINNFPDINGLLISLYFSLITITTIGYGDYRPLPGLPQILAGLEAVIGLFLWALLITVFSRRYLK